jgi:hypothetical protein
MTSSSLVGKRFVPSFEKTSASSLNTSKAPRAPGTSTDDAPVAALIFAANLAARGS